MEVPKCPDKRHAKATVVRAGWYGRDGQKRQRWLCTPKSGNPHRFTETLPRIVSGEADEDGGHACELCATRLEPWEGQPAPRLYGFTARHVAYALTLVATGGTYRHTASLVRQKAGRALSTRAGTSASGKVLPPANEHGQLVSDWVEVFAPVIWEAYAPTAWPQRVVLDDTGFRLPRGTARTRGAAVASGFSVLCAMGYSRLNKPYVAALEAVSGGASTSDYTHLFRRLDGAPTLVVTDGGVSGKAAAHWPGHPAPRLHRCEWHLARQITEALPDRVRRDPEDPLHADVRYAVTSVPNWDALLTAVAARAHEGGFARTQALLGRLDPVVRTQAAARTPFGPHSIGPAEEVLRVLRNVLDDRAARLTNKRRTDALLMLLAAHRNGWADETKWSEIIRNHLVSHRGHAREQRQHADPRNQGSLQ